MKRLLPILSLLVLAAGCRTVGGNRSSVFSQPSSSRGGNYPSPYVYDTADDTGWETSSARPVSRQSAAAREATRLSTLEANVSRLQGQVDAMTASQESVLSQANAAVTRAGSSQDSIRAELDALRAEVAALKAENRSLREEQNAQRSQIAAMPDRLSKLIAQSTPRTTARSSSSSGGKQSYLEHTVASGDTVSAIASAYGVKASDIVRINSLKDAGAIRVGQKLLIPDK